MSPPAPRPTPTGRTGLAGRPVLDGRAWFQSVDWSEVPPPRADDVGIETEDGRHLTTEAEVLAWFGELRDRA